MIRKSLQILAWGVLLIAAALYVLELVGSNFEAPQVSLVKWGVLLVVGLVIVFGHKREKAFYHHLPH
jgi:hypothetical protein